MENKEIVKQLKEIRDTIEYDTTPGDMVEMLEELIKEIEKELEGSG